MKLFLKLFFNFTLILVLISCSSTTIIKTNDPDVNIYVNGKHKGKGSAVHTDMKMSWLSSKVRLQKDGCQDNFEEFSKNEQLDILPLISGFIFIFPFLWTMKYKAVRQYNFVCSSLNQESF